MTLGELEAQFTRVENHFRMHGDMDRDVEYREWVGALLQLDKDALAGAVSELIREASDTFWPALGVVLEKTRTRRGGERNRARCQRCMDSTWIDAHPWWSNGFVYKGYRRCPDCGVPEPVYKEHKYRRPLNATEYAQWLRGELPQPPIYVAKQRGKVKAGASGMERFKAPAFAQPSRDPGEEG